MTSTVETRPADEGDDGRLYLVDGSGYIFRAFHALPPMTRSDGTPVNAVYGFVNMLSKLLEDTRARRLAVIFDTSRVTFRNDIYADYKANRPDPPDELVPQFDLIREATRAYAVPCIEMDGYEADDLIATYARLAREQGRDVIIVSSDKDLMQLVGGRVWMMDPMKNRVIGPDQVVERFGVGSDKVIDVQALAGDSTDNVPGVPGIGVKTAAQLIGAFGDLDALLARAGEITQTKRRETLIENAHLARLSRELVTLRDDVPVRDAVDGLVVGAPEPEGLLRFLERQGFKSMIARLRAGRAGGAEAETSSATGASTAVLVRTEAELAVWIGAARTAGRIAIRVETCAPGPAAGTLIGIALSVDGGRGCYVPLAHRTPGADELAFDGAQDALADGQLPMETTLARLRPLLEDPGVLKIGHDAKNDMTAFVRFGIEPVPVDDVMILSYVLEGGTHGHGLDELARRHLDRDKTKRDAVTGAGRNRVDFARAPLDKACAYAAEAAILIERLHRALKPRLVRERVTAVYESMERALIPVLLRMERAGIKVDRRVLADLSREFDRRSAALADEIYGLAGRPFNIGSPKQLGDILFGEMGLAGGRKTKTGAYGTGADVLEGLAAQGHDLPIRVLDWRQLTKLKGTYTDALAAAIDARTGRVHTSYAQAVASTGRLSSNDPNLQNIPVRTEDGRKIRRAFVAEDGWRLMSADYSQIELRLLAHVAGIDALKEAFRNGADIHAITASEVFGLPVEGMEATVRNRAKAINFGIIYGISPFGLGRQLGIPQGEARAYIDSYFAHYPGIRDYMENAKAFARAHGFVTTLFGRKCHVPGINDKNPAKRSFSERAAINAPLQGAAADIVKRAMIRVPAALARAGLKARMLLQVHDELLLEVPEAECDATGAIIRKVMTAAAALSVPLVVDIGHGRDWADAH